MKNKLIVIIFLGLSFGVFAQITDNRSSVIRELNGTVELRSDGASDFVHARVGDLVTEHTTISTGFRSMALLEVGSAIITIRPLTNLTLTQIISAHGTEILNINMQTGRMQVDVNPPLGTRASLRVISPSAVASVRGTSFEFDTRNLSVSNGTVHFQGNRGYTFQVNAGSAIVVGGRGAALPPSQGDTVSQPLVPAVQDTTVGTSESSSITRGLAEGELGIIYRPQ